MSFQYRFVSGFVLSLTFMATAALATDTQNVIPTQNPLNTIRRDQGSRDPRAFFAQLAMISHLSGQELMTLGQNEKSDSYQGRVQSQSESFKNFPRSQKRNGKRIREKDQKKKVLFLSISAPQKSFEELLASGLEEDYIQAQSRLKLHLKYYLKRHFSRKFPSFKSFIESKTGSQWIASRVDQLGYFYERAFYDSQRAQELLLQSLLSDLSRLTLHDLKSACSKKDTNYPRKGQVQEAFLVQEEAAVVSDSEMTDQTNEEEELEIQESLYQLRTLKKMIEHCRLQFESLKREYQREVDSTRGLLSNPGEVEITDGIKATEDHLKYFEEQLKSGDLVGTVNQIEKIKYEIRALRSDFSIFKLGLNFCWT